MSIVARAFVSAAPQLLQPELNQGYRDLVAGFDKLEQHFSDLGVERILYWSTQWLSVLGQLYQAGSNLKGTHVDENWHASCELPFDFRVDRELAAQMCKAGETAGFPGQCTDYRDFPVDTATILADRLLNPRRLPVSMVACNVYCDGDKTRQLAATMANVLENDAKKTAVVGISLLTTSYHTVSVDLREDCLRSAADASWLQQFEESARTGNWHEFNAVVDSGAKKLRTDMGLKAVRWLEGTMPGKAFDKPWQILASGPLYGASGLVALIP